MGHAGLSGSALFTGFIDDEDKLAAWVDADLVVTLSFFGFPIAFLEACAVGTPIITAILGDHLEWINANAGYVAPPTCHDVAKATCMIISNNELAKKFSRNCREITRSEFSLNMTAEGIGQVYEEAIQTNKAQRL